MNRDSEVARVTDAASPRKGGGLRVNDKPVTDEKATLGAGDLSGGEAVKLSLGRKRHILLKPV